MICPHFIPESPCCARGVIYRELAGGGAFTMIMRLPCVPISNRRGETARRCIHHSPTEVPAPAVNPILEVKGI